MDMESNSISNQKQILLDYAKKNGRNFHHTGSTGKFHLLPYEPPHKSGILVFPKMPCYNSIKIRINLEYR